jgi:hypothetical protein
LRHEGADILSSGYHRLGANVPGKVTGYHAHSLPVGGIVAGMPVLPMPTPPSTSPNVSSTLIAGEIGAPALNRKQARQSGFTGDSCTNCQSMRVKRNGSCLVCEACGTTTGCS